MTRSFITNTATALLAVTALASAAKGVKKITTRNTPRVIGGSDAKKGAYPWVVALDAEVRGDSSIYSCGGTLIAPGYVLTAAHCFYPAKTGNAGKAYFGSHTSCFAGKCDAEATRTITKVTIHPNYNNNKVLNDIAILELDRPVTAIKPIAMESGTFKSGGDAKVLGWGVINAKNEAMARVLQEGTVSMVTKEDCISNYKYSKRDIKAGMMCAYASGRDGCQGDSGGPLFAVGSGKVTGIVSWGEGCAKKNYPGVYTEIAYFKDWMTTIMGSWPDTGSGTTKAPATTATQATTEEPTTKEATTKAPTTEEPTTKAATTKEPTTEKPTTGDACDCMSSWSYDGETESGCSATWDFDEPWCYVRDAETCTSATASSVWDALSWKNCKPDHNCGAKNRRGCQKSSECQWDGNAFECIGAEEELDSCAAKWNKNSCAKVNGCRWSAGSCWKELVCPAGADACCGLTQRGACKKNKTCTWLHGSTCMPKNA